MKFRSFFAFLWAGRRRSSGRRPGPGTKVFPELESLEELCLPSANTISGYVYYDANNNGQFDASEQPIANNAIELHNNAGVVVGSTTTDQNGYYAFTSDSTIDTTPTDKKYVIPIPERKTNQPLTLTEPKFNPDWGTLTSVEIDLSAQISSDIQVENEDPSPQTITGTVSGKLSLTAPDINSQMATDAITKTFAAPAYDLTPDFAGTSGTDFGKTTVNGSKTFLFTDASVLADYNGANDSVLLTFNGLASSTASGGGNMCVCINSTVSGTLTLIYHYTPSNALRNGNYTIVQPAVPPGYIEGLVSSNGTLVPQVPGPATIPVTLAGSDLPNNDFGELVPVADLAILKTGSPNPVNGGAALTYTLTVSDGGPLAASNVVVKDTLPNGVNFVSASGAGWTCTQSGNLVTCTRPTLANGASSVITIIVIAPNTAESLTNTATVTSDTPDNNQANNQASATTQVVMPTSSISALTSSFGNPRGWSFLSKLDFLAAGGTATADPVLLAQITYVDGLYRTLLDRPADYGGLVTYLKYLRAGGNNAVVVQTLWLSDEHLGLMVDNFYEYYLHRSADPAGRPGWIAILRSGVSETEVIRMFLNSTEYQSAHADNVSFITGLYTDVLGRIVDGATLTHWEQALQGGMSRDALIRLILTSDEALGKVVDEDYQNILHRPSAPSERQGWLAQLKSGQITPDSLTQQFLASAEFYNMAVAASQS
jgi:uncharacterized repeat protein (TIGR01451 family)